MAGNTFEYDVIVVGAGIEGSAAAYQLARSGRRTLLLEQFPLPHSRGSSHGQSRITRRGYGPKGFYTHMMAESFDLLHQLERETGQQLFIKNGMLVIGRSGHPYIDGTREQLERYGVPHEVYDATTVGTKFPMLKFPKDFVYLLENGGGVLMADKILQAFQTQFKKFGGSLHDGEAMLGLDSGPVVRVTTSKAVYRAQSVVLACGAWAGPVLARLGVNLPLQVKRITVCYWKEKVPGSHGYDRFPTFLSASGGDSFDVYGLPSEEYPGLVKICLHDGPTINADNRDVKDNGWVLDRIRKYVTDHFPQLESTPSIVEPCIYTMTADEDFIIDRHPRYNNVIIAAGFSGHGFKLAPVIGKVLSQLATNQTPSYDLTPFKLSRFTSKSKM